MLWESWLECDLLQIHFPGRYTFREGGGLRDPTISPHELNVIYSHSVDLGLTVRSFRGGGRENISTFWLFEDEGHKNTFQNLMEGEKKMMMFWYARMCVCLTNLPPLPIRTPWRLFLKSFLHPSPRSAFCLLPYSKPLYLQLGNLCLNGWILANGINVAIH